MKKRFKFKGIFSTLLFSYIIILLVPGILTFGLMAATYNLSHKNNVTKAAGELERGSAVLERQLELMDANATEFTYDYVLGWILQLKENETLEKNIVAVTQFRERLNDRFRDIGLLRNYSVLLNNELMFNQSTMAIGSEFYFNNYRNYEELSYDEYRTLSFSSEGGRSILPLQNIGVGRYEQRAMTYNYSFKKNLTAAGEADAVIQFLMMEDDIKELFSSLLGNGDSQVFIINQEGQILAGLSGNRKAEMITLDTSKMISDKGSFKMVRDKEYFTVVYYKNISSELQYAVAIPERVLLQDVRVLAGVLGVLLVVSLFLELLIGIHFSGKYARPLHNLLLNIQSFLAPEGSMEETILPQGQQIYQHLSEGFNQLAERNQRIFLNYLYSGEMKNDEEIIKEAKNSGIRFGGQDYCVVVFGLAGDSVSTKWHLELNRERTLLAKSFIESDSLVCLLGAVALNEEQVAEAVEHIQEILKEQKIRTTGIGAGRIYECESMITFSYMQAKDASELKNGEFIKYSELFLQQNVFVYPESLAEKLLNTVKHGEQNQIEQIFSYIYEENITSRQLSKAMERILLSAIAATLFQLYDDVVTNEEISEITRGVNHYSNFLAALELLKEQFMKIWQHRQLSREDQQEKNRQVLMDYIDREYVDSQLGVAKAAMDFSLSEGYFSQYFKDIVGEVFSSYLERYRIKKAKELILEGELDIEQIASMVGYSSGGTFRRAFKRMTGLTPSIWRKEQ